MKTTLAENDWTEVVTTTVDTILSSPDGDVKFSTEDPDESGFTDGSTLLLKTQAAVIPAGLTVWVWPVDFSYGHTPAVNHQVFGI